MDEFDNNHPPKRNDVGYKRPPPEHRFKKGHPRPPRKKTEPKKISARDVMWRVLQEHRRVIVNGKALWRTNAELIARRAFVEAEKGSSTLQRLLNEILLGAEPETTGDELPEVITTRDGDKWGGSNSIGTIYVQETPDD